MIEFLGLAIGYGLGILIMLVIGKVYIHLYTKAMEKDIEELLEQAKREDEAAIRRMRALLEETDGR